MDESMILRLASSNENILIQDNTRDREELARSIHDKSARQTKPFISLDCNLLSNEMLFSELFGHEKGSFNGAHIRKLGLLEMVTGGTLFLDGIHEIGPGIQAKLLSFIKSKTFYRVGSNLGITSDVRLICGTDDILEMYVYKDMFREDLYYRINTLVIGKVVSKEVINKSKISFDSNISLYELEKQFVLEGIKHFKGDKAQTAKSLGITIKTLYNKLHEYGEFETHLK